MTDTYVPDISEFQANINDAQVLNWTKAVIIRCAYGDAHDDKAWYGGQRRQLLHSGGAKFVGIYQYDANNKNILSGTVEGSKQ